LPPPQRHGRRGRPRRTPPRRARDAGRARPGRVAAPRPPLEAPRPSSARPAAPPAPRCRREVWRITVAGPGRTGGRGGAKGARLVRARFGHGAARPRQRRQGRGSSQQRTKCATRCGSQCERDGEGRRGVVAVRTGRGAPAPAVTPGVEWGPGSWAGAAAGRACPWHASEGLQPLAATKVTVARGMRGRVRRAARSAQAAAGRAGPQTGPCRVRESPRARAAPRGWPGLAWTPVCRRRQIAAHRVTCRERFLASRGGVW
jgi:hypothetical protein